MSLVNVDGLSVHFGPDVILDDVSFVLGERERVGLIGRNGAGKSTLLRVLAGDLEPDTGQIARRRGLRVGYLRQRDHFGAGSTGRDGADPTVFEAALQPFAELEALERRARELEAQLATRPDDAAWLAEYGELHSVLEHRGAWSREATARRVLSGMGFGPADEARPTSTLSGGERNRLALAVTILSQPELLLLDEPTNHLDLRAAEALEGILQDYPGTVVVVSHDRWLLDRVAQKILDVENGEVWTYPGNYTFARREKEARLARELELFERQSEEIARQEEYIRRNHAGQKSKQAKSRERMLEKVERLARPAEDTEAMRLRFERGEPSGHDVVTLRGVGKRYVERPVLHDVDLSIYRGDRVGVVGPNGSGKSTLLRLMLGRERPDSGRAVLGERVRVAYYDQELAGLDLSNTVVGELATIRPELSEGALRGIAGVFLFRGDEAFAPLQRLSGGERARVALAKVMLRPANLLVLDEPTNHLDIQSREVLEEALRAFPGTLVVVSHDRYFLDRVVGRLGVLVEGTVEMHAGNWSDYVARRAAAAAEAEAGAASSGDGGASKRGHLHRAAVKDQRAKEKRLKKLEDEIAAAERSLASLEARLVDPANASAWQALADWGRERDGVRAELDRLMEQWAEAAEAAEAG